MYHSLWQTVLGEIELSVSRASYLTWFKNTDLLDVSDGKAVIGVPNIFTKQQLEVKFAEQIGTMLVKNGANVSKVTFKISSGGTKRKPNTSTAKKPANSTLSIADITTTAQQQTSHNITTRRAGNGLNAKFTFDNFIVGSSNDLAYSACQAVAQHPGTKYNPLFIYGGVGLGKTHLMQAAGNEMLRQNPKAKILYTSIETFVNDFLESIRFKKKGFADRYRTVDMLIIDDMQFIAGKEKTQEEFFHTFNALHQADKQIIISSDKPPKAIPTLVERLRSRLEWGMAIDIQSPDFETRCAILQAKAAQQTGAEIDHATVEYLATHVQTNIRELEGALNQLLAFCEMRRLPISVETATGLMGDMKTVRPAHLSSRQVVQTVAKHYQVELTDIMSPKRDKHIVMPRQVAMYLLRSELHMSFPKIARELGRKDHTTAIHSIEKVEKGLKLDYLLQQQLKAIREQLYA